MTQSAQITRRSLLAGAAALPVLGALPAWAGAPMLGAKTARYNRFMLGAFEVTTLLAGTAARDKPHDIFGQNVSDAEFAAASAAANIPADRVQFFFTPTVVNTGSELVLFDTGLNAKGITAALGEAGYTPDQVDTVVLTHMHGDHIGGLTDADGNATFANARYVTGQVQFDAWSGRESKAFDTKMRPMAPQAEFLSGGGTVSSGITAMEAFGHTPGHMIYRLESGNKQLVLGADFANHYVWSLAYPDWEVRFDQDKAAAAATRRKILGMLAADKIPFVGYHMPWPGTGYVAAKGDGFQYEATSYQLML